MQRKIRAKIILNSFAYNMAEMWYPKQPQPTTWGSLTISTYTDPSVISETDILLQDDCNDEGNISAALRLEENREFMDSLMAPPTTWTLLTRTSSTSQGIPTILIKEPTASAISYGVLNPFLYRRIKDVGSLNDLAHLLRSSSDWESIYDRMMQDGRVFQSMVDFRQMPEDVPQYRIEFRFDYIVNMIASILKMRIHSKTTNGVVVGGLLARHEYDLRRETDILILNPDDGVLIATVSTTHTSLGDGDVWYRESRGVQILSALYAYNAPVFLYSNRQWKLFVENDKRNAVLTFPFHDDPNHPPHGNSMLVDQMGRNFLKAVVICLLSTRQVRSRPRDSTKFAGMSTIEATSELKFLTGDHIHDAEKKRSRAVVPTFLSGFVGDKPVYSVIRVPSPDEDAIMDE